MKRRDRKKQAEEQNRSAKDVVRERGLFVVALLDRFCDLIYNALSNGFLGFIFSAYSTEQRALENGFVSRYTFKSTIAGKISRKTREVLSREYEESYFLKKWRDLLKKLLATPIKSYGKMLLSFGIFSVLIYFILLLVPEFDTGNIGALITGMAVCIASTPLLLSRQNLAFSIGSNKITRTVFSEIFDFRDETYQVKIYKSRAITNALILLGMLAGVLTFVVDPLMILSASLMGLVAAIIIITPEIGVIISLFSVPFFSLADIPTISLAILIIITTFGYCIKLIRGKRVIKFELIDILICTFILLILLGGVLSATPDASRQSAAMSCVLILGYFLVSNLMRTEKWLSRCGYALVSSASLVSVTGILQYVLGLVDTKWLDTSYFPNIAGRSTAMFENSNYLAFYLVAVFPFALHNAITREKGKSKLLSVISCILIIVCTVLTWSRGAWIAIIFTGILFLLIYSRKTLRILISIIILIPYAITFMPPNVLARFKSIGDMTDSSTMYRFYTWKGSLRILDDFLWSGIGYGTEAYRAIYPEYAYAGIEAAAHSHSLFLQIFIGLGLGGILVFLLTMFVFAQKNFEYFKKPFNENSRLIAATAFSAIIGMLVMGLFDYIWYNYRIFFMFWAILGISIAAIRFGNREVNKKEFFISSDAQKSAIDIEFEDR